MTNIVYHWWWRPGWRVGRRMFTWHVTFEDVPAVQELAADARARLADLPGLDLIPGQWLHLTTQSVGFTDEVSDAELTAIINAARARLAAIEPPHAVIGPARVASEGVACGINPVGVLDPLRDALRAAIADVWGPERVPEGPQWTPHVSVAYANATGPAGPIEAAMSGASLSAAVTVSTVQLIRLGRDHHVYEWETCASVPIG